MSHEMLPPPGHDQEEPVEEIKKRKPKPVEARTDVVKPELAVEQVTQPEPERPTVWDRLRVPFPPEQIGKLPRVPKSMKDNKREDCPTCGGYHVQGPGVIHLDYVGHAAVTSRLLECDPFWNWDPVAKDEHGRPIFEMDGDDKVGLWIWLHLTDGGAVISRMGYGSVPRDTNDAEKQLIGDALRNAAMRFGVAVDLWMKSGEEKDVTENAGGNGSSKQVVERLCSACGVIFEQKRKPKASDFDTVKFGVKVGDPILKCPDCGKWVPVMDPPGKTYGDPAEKPAANAKAQPVTEEALGKFAAQHLGVDAEVAAERQRQVTEKLEQQQAKEPMKFAPGHGMRRVTPQHQGDAIAACECGLEFTDSAEARAHLKATIEAAEKPDDLPF